MALLGLTHWTIGLWVFFKYWLVSQPRRTKRVNEPHLPFKRERNMLQTSTSPTESLGTRMNLVTGVEAWSHLLNWRKILCINFKDGDKLLKLNHLGQEIFFWWAIIVEKTANKTMSFIPLLVESSKQILYAYFSICLYLLFLCCLR